MRERPILFSAPMVRAILEGRKTQTRRICRGQRELSNIHDFRLDQCPYGQPGDRLWVRETFIGARGYDRDPPSRFGNKPIWYCADGEPDRAQWWQLSDRKRPAIHMPRWASRITLEVTDVRVERLQDISQADALAEGITHSTLNDPRVEYRWLWESINGAGSWDANPWVWAVSFRRLEAGHG